MTSEQLLKIIKNGENSATELKSSQNKLARTIYESICEPLINSGDTQNDTQNKTAVRHKKILDIIKTSSSISVKSLSDNLNVSPITIKRDLAKMNIRWSGSSKTGCWVIYNENIKS